MFHAGALAAHGDKAVEQGGPHTTTLPDCRLTATWCMNSASSGSVDPSRGRSSTVSRCETLAPSACSVVKPADGHIREI
jgi:hypothetical protein